MKNLIAIFIFITIAGTSQAQFNKAVLQASGLTCSMCSKAVKVALEEVSFIEKVMVDIKKQQYNLTFKQDAVIDFDALSKAVEDAGFSVASLKIETAVTDVKAVKDQHIQIGDKYFHFLNGKGQTINGNTTFTLVDKSFVTEKEFKKYSNSSKMECVKTGKAEDCCEKGSITADTRVYHVII